MGGSIFIEIQKNNPPLLKSWSISIVSGMLSVLAQVNKDKQKNDHKTNKKLGLEDDAIVTCEKVLSGLEIKERQLIEIIQKDEKSYGTAAQSKFERRLKQGASGQIAQKHEMDLKSSVSKKETKISSVKEKIKNLESQKDPFVRAIDAKIESLEAQKAQFVKTLDAKIEKLENDITGEERAIEITQEYFRPLIERCYEEKSLDIAYPPSYYKKKQELKDCQSEITTLKTNILAMKAANFDKKPQLDKQAQVEQRLQKLRDQARREFLAKEKEDKEKEEEKNREILEQRKAEREARDKRDEERWESQRLIKKHLEEEGLLEE